MKSDPICIPCYLKQALSAAKEITLKPELLKEALDCALRIIPDLELDDTPAYNSYLILKEIYNFFNEKDPFRGKKIEHNKMAMQLYPELKKMVKKSKNPLYTAVKLALAGNVIDIGILPSFDIISSIDEVISTDLAIDYFEHFLKSIENSKNLLYLLDNAGEAVFDRILAEEIENININIRFIFGVNGSPILNDATEDDAYFVGLDKIGKIVSNGTDMIGNPLEKCSQEFRNEFKEAGIIISKGQGNYETLDEEKANIFYLLKAKCEVVANSLNVPLGAYVLNYNLLL